MSSYDVFATYYDSLTKNVDYAGRADYLMELFQRLNHPAGITLDLACGTGSLTLELYKRGVDVYGVDGSPSMLMIAKDKCYESDADILFLCQKMQSIDLYGTIDTAVCALDSVNHLGSLSDIKKTFEKVSLFMNKDGYFIFDFNTIYKHREILAGNTFVYDMSGVYCVWQNVLRLSNYRIDISLDFFEKTENGLYSRSNEHFSEITCSQEEIIAMLKEAGFSAVTAYEDLTFENPTEKTEKIIFIAKK